jgi:hypothetical protein
MGLSKKSVIGSPPGALLAAVAAGLDLFQMKQL